MKRSLVVYLLVQAVYPLCLLIANQANVEFVLFSGPVYCIAVSAASIFLVRKLREGEASALVIPALPLAIFHALTLMLTLPRYGGIAAGIVAFCGWSVFHRAPKGIWRTLCKVLSVLLTLGLVLMTPIWLFASVMGYRKVVREVDSPGGQYTAIVTDINEGALGGDTLVEVRDNEQTIPILLGSFISKEEVYRGPWGQWEDLDLVWEGEDVLCINGTACSVRSGDMATIANIAGTLGVGIHGGVVLENSDTHGGFLGDGLTTVKIQCTLETPEGEYWHELPLTGGAAGIPPLLDVDIPGGEKGYFYFRDRHSQASDPASYNSWSSRYSCNFTFALWDAEAGILYYYKLDT